MQKSLSSLIIAGMLICMQQTSVAGITSYVKADTIKKSDSYVNGLIDRLFYSLHNSLQNKKNRFRDQLVLIDSVLEMDPSNTSVLHLQAQIFANLKDHDKAIAVLSKTISHHSQLIKLYTFRGALYDMQGKKSNAKKDYQKTLELVNSRIDSLAEGNENKLFLTGSASILQLLLGGTPQKVLSTFDRLVVGTYDTDKTQEVRQTIERFDKEEFLASYRRGNL